MDVITELLLPKLDGVRHHGGYWKALCPAHEDREPSLSIGRGTSQPVVLRCHAGCETVDILAKIGLTPQDLCLPQEDRKQGEWTPHGEAVAVYRYYDENSKLLYEVCRTADKQFPVRVPDPSRKTGYRWSMGNVRRVLFRLPQVIEAVKDGRMIYVVEGEKDVQALERAGVVATCNPGGAGKWREDYSEFLRDAIVVIVADKDKPGQAHARQVMASLKPLASAVEICEAAVGKDVSDHLAAGRPLSDLVLTCAGEDYKPDLAPDLYEFLAVVDPPNAWVIPQLLERGDRLILTGFEGTGKSLLLRQLAICAAAGTHPFFAELFPPQKVLFVDCENPDRKSRRWFRSLAEIATLRQAHVPEGGLRIIQKPEGIDLAREGDAAWLTERVTAHAPDLLIIGPFYRLHAADTNEESAARAVVAALDTARLRNECALVTEAHVGHGENGSRNIRPFGSSLLMRWPEFGYGMKPLGDPDEAGHHQRVAVRAWRGPREERHWPAELAWGGNGEWPWVARDAGWTPHSVSEQEPR